jgi:hypothetical protein
VLGEHRPLGILGEVPDLHRVLPAQAPQRRPLAEPVLLLAGQAGQLIAGGHGQPVPGGLGHDHTSEPGADGLRRQDRHIPQEKFQAPVAEQEAVQFGQGRREIAAVLPCRRHSHRRSLSGTGVPASPAPGGTENGQPTGN